MTDLYWHFTTILLLILLLLMLLLYAYLHRLVKLRAQVQSLI